MARVLSALRLFSCFACVAGSACSGVPRVPDRQPEKVLETDDKFTVCPSQLTLGALGNVWEEGNCEFETSACVPEYDPFPFESYGAQKMEITSATAAGLGLDVSQLAVGADVARAQRFTLLLRYKTKQQYKVRRDLGWFVCVWTYHQDGERFVDTLYEGEVGIYVAQERTEAGKVGVEGAKVSEVNLRADLVHDEGYTYKRVRHIDGLIGVAGAPVSSSMRPAYEKNEQDWFGSGKKPKLPGSRCFVGTSLSQVVGSDGRKQCVGERSACLDSAMIRVARELVGQCGISIDVRETEGISSQIEYVLKGSVEWLFEPFDPRVISDPGMGDRECFSRCDRVMCMTEKKFEQVCNRIKADAATR